MKLFIWYQDVAYGIGLVLAIAENVTHARQIILEKIEGRAEKMEITKCISDKPGEIHSPIPCAINLWDLYRE